MLKTFRKNREQKAVKKAEEMLNKAIAQLDGKLYKQAMIEFQNAYQLDPNTVHARLDREFNHFLEIREYEAALSIGLILVKIKKDDYELVNLVGNCARRQKNFKQANNLYRFALKINRNYPLAFYNLAASMGKVEKYDGDIKKSLKVFDDIKEYILPEYSDDPDFGDRYEQRIHVESKANYDTKQKQLQAKIKEKEDSGHFQEVKVLRLEEVKLKRTSGTISKKTFDNIFKELSAENGTEEEMNQSEKEMLGADEDIRIRDIYNFGIFSLQHKKTDIALNCFYLVKESGIKYKYVDMLIAISMAISGKTKEAIKFFVDELGEERYNRFFNINLGLMYRGIGNRLLSTKYLAIGAELLEKSDGLYHLSDLIEIADQCALDGNYKKALRLYNVAVSEVDKADIWSKIGEVYINLKKYDEATRAFREILRLDPKSAHASEQLKKLHDIFLYPGRGFFP